MANDASVFHCIRVSLYLPSRIASDSRDQDNELGSKQCRRQWNPGPFGDQQGGKTTRLELNVAPFKVTGTRAVVNIRL